MCKSLGVASLLVLLSTSTGCAVPYKPLGGRDPFEVGFVIEPLGGDSYRIEYWGGGSSDYSRLEKLLHRYADEICVSEPTVGKIDRSVFVPEVWTSRRKPHDTFGVSAIMVCAQIDKALMSKASVAR